MFALFTSILSFIAGYATGKISDESLEEILHKLNEKAKELDIDFKKIFAEALDSLEDADSDEIKANVIRAMDKIKKKTIEIAAEEDIDVSIERLKTTATDLKNTVINKMEDIHHGKK